MQAQILGAALPRTTLVVLALATATLPGSINAGTSQQTDAGLERALSHLVDAFPGRAGVAVRHIDSGIGASVDADTPYPMASTYKVPILVEMMARIETGDLSLDTEIELQPADQHIGSGLLQDLWAPGMTLTLRNLATMMIILSDNSATDMIIDRLGAAAITARMTGLGYDDIRVDRTTLELILDYLGAPYAGLEEATGAEINAALAQFDFESSAAQRAAEDFYEDGKDVAAAAAMTDLLVRIAKGEVVSKEASATIIEILEKTQTGANRLRGLLPGGITLAHKTGTIGRVVNDVGIVTLPDDLGQFVISVFTLGDEGVDTTTNERLIADLARTSYDFFLFQPATH
jgi:beta-lactamase class A